MDETWCDQNHIGHVTGKNVLWMLSTETSIIMTSTKPTSMKFTDWDVDERRLQVKDCTLLYYTMKDFEQCRVLQNFNNLNSPLLIVNFYLVETLFCLCVSIRNKRPLTWPQLQWKTFDRHSVQNIIFFLIAFIVAIFLLWII